MSSVVHNTITKLFPTKEELCCLVKESAIHLREWDRKSVFDLPVNGLVKVSLYPLVSMSEIGVSKPSAIKPDTILPAPSWQAPKIVIASRVGEEVYPGLNVSLPELLGSKPNYSTVHNLMWEEWKSVDFYDIVLRWVGESLLQITSSQFIFNNKWHKEVVTGVRGKFIKETYLNPDIWHHVCHTLGTDGKVAHVPEYIQKSIQELKCVWGLSNLPFILTVNSEQTRFFSHVVGWLNKRKTVGSPLLSK